MSDYKDFVDVLVELDGIEEQFPAKVHRDIPSLNGWIMPMFNKATAEKILGLLIQEGNRVKQQYGENNPGDYIGYNFLGNGSLEIDIYEDEGLGGLVRVFEPVNIKNVAYYTIDDGLNWDEVE